MDGGQQLGGLVLLAGSEGRAVIFFEACRRDLTLRFCPCLRWLLRMRRSADLVFGIFFA